MVEEIVAHSEIEGPGGAVFIQISACPNNRLFLITPRPLELYELN